MKVRGVFSVGLAIFMKITSPRFALKTLLSLDNLLYYLQGQASLAYGGGTHPKHRLMDYHQFFIKNIKPGERVLDIGSGSGLLAFDIVNGVKDCKVVGIEIDEKNHKLARRDYSHPNIEFVHIDAMKFEPGGEFDVIVLSNVLEHIWERNILLKKMIQTTKPDRILLRVPSFERDWRVPLKKELGVDYLLDRTHFIEYTMKDFMDEMSKCGLEITHIESKWGEIWAIAEPKS